MPKDTRRRLQIDVADILEKIENAKPERSWKALSLAAKVRLLLDERLEQIELEEKDENQ